MLPERGPEFEEGPRKEPARAAPPWMGPDFLDFAASTEMSNILPSSPDFLMSPPVYGIAVDVMVGCLSLY